MSQISAKFTLDAGDVDFYDDEVEGMTLNFNKNRIMTFPKNELPDIRIYGNLQYSFILTIRERKQDTVTKINQLISENDTFSFYYAYRFNPGETINVIRLPKGHRRTLIKGDWDTIFHYIHFNKV